MFSSLSNSSSTMIHWSLVCHVWPGREADVIPIRPLFPWTRSSIHHSCQMLSTHSHLDQTQGPTASVDSKGKGRLFHEIAPTVATLKSRNTDAQLLHSLVIIITKTKVHKSTSCSQDDPEFTLPLQAAWFGERQLSNSVLQASRKTVWNPVALNTSLANGSQWIWDITPACVTQV